MIVCYSSSIEISGILAMEEMYVLIKAKVRLILFFFFYVLAYGTCRLLWGPEMVGTSPLVAQAEFFR